MIQALEENDIPIDYVTGTSMGAIVGSLYAMGFTPADMMELITSREFGYWSTGTIDPSLSYYFSAPTPSPAMFTFNIGRSDSTAAVPASFISPLPMNFEFMRLFRRTRPPVEAISTARWCLSAAWLRGRRRNAK